MRAARNVRASRVLRALRDAISRQRQQEALEVASEIAAEQRERGRADHAGDGLCRKGDRVQACDDTDSVEE
jgi:hypothetical protein